MNNEHAPTLEHSSVIQDDHLKECMYSVIGADAEKLFWIQSKSHQDIPLIPAEFKGVGNLNAINDIHPLNTYLRKVNEMMQKGQYFVIKLETKRDRKDRLLDRWPGLFKNIFYTFDFLFNRVMPKLFFSKPIYFWLTKGKNQVISISEALARAVFCGFDIANYFKAGPFTYIISKKIHEPNDHNEFTEGIIIKLFRVGKGRKIIPIYKIRTMNPYSEYLQEYIYDKYGTRDGDKIENDFRVTKWGKIFRKYWIDELPMLVNWIKGDLKLVGVRPLSQHKFNTYPTDLQEKVSCLNRV